MLHVLYIAALAAAASAGKSSSSGNAPAAASTGSSTSSSNAGSSGTSAGSNSVSPSGLSACTAAPALAGVPNLMNAKWLPANWVTAKIVNGDTVAQQLWQSIQNNATYAKALAIAPNVVKNYDPVFTGYSSSDPSCWWSYSTCTKPKISYLPNDHITCKEGSTWGLSVDDGPLPAHCHLYELYRENNIVPSLFYIGSNVQQYTSSAAEGLALGGPVCVHTWSHQYTTSLTNEEVFAELYYTKLILKRVLGYTPRCFRPPFGDIDDRVRTIAYALEMDVWIWDNDTNDWQLGDGATQSTIQSNFNQIIGNASSSHGTIVLDHELSIPIANMWVSNYPAIKKAFKNIVAAHICENVTAPWAEPDAPMYPDFASWQNGAKATGNLVAQPNMTAQVYFAGVGANQKLPFTSSTAGNATTNPLQPGVVGAANNTLSGPAANSSSSTSSTPATTTGSSSSLRLSFGVFGIALAAASLLN